MTELIIGGSASGKSAYAESRAAGLAAACTDAALIYLAAMRRSGREAAERIEKHQQMRQGRGFRTIEMPGRISVLLPELPKGAVVLLEDLSNLFANLYFDAQEQQRFALIDQICTDLAALRQQSAHLLLVGSQIFCELPPADPVTYAYCRAFGVLQQRIAAEAERVAQIRAGIATVWKDSAE